jgi:RHS repeat-associated protein
MLKEGLEVLVSPTQVALEALQLQGEMTVITYSYDALNRLTGAQYDSGVSFECRYDPAGNRLEQTLQLDESRSLPPVTNVYTYDIANRLTAVDGIAYSWDANGNLLSDGINSYTYDHANRLKTADDGQSSSSYAYNGQGDRLQQTVDGVTTTYTLDLESGLTEVLSDGSETYLYGRSRMAQVSPAGTEYFLGDVLGSVRQLVDESGEVILAESYQPFGEVLNSAGSGTSIYGYTGEMTDPTGLVYLRARYYAPSDGRFLTRDPWQGDAYKPISYNAWLYTSNNPIGFTDPTGKCLDVDMDGECDLQWQKCGDNLCPKPPQITQQGPVHQSYKALLETRCNWKNGKLYPWWKSRGAMQKEYANMGVTELVAVLIYTEGSPIRLGAPGATVEVRQAWRKMITNRYAYQCTYTGPCNITDGGRQLGYGLSQFLSWSPRFRYWDKNYAGLGTSSIYDNQYGDPSWAFLMAKQVVGLGRVYDSSGPYGGMNTQSIKEQNHFLDAYKEYGKFSIQKEGVYYMWGNLSENSQGDLVILTKSQETYHCGSNKEKFPCGSTPK